MRTLPLRRRTRRTLVAAVASIVAAVVLASMLTRADQLARDYGERAVVAVAARELVVGTELVDDDVRWVERPTALIGGHLADAPIGRVVTERMLEGEVVVGERLAPEGAHGPAALAPPGSRALAISTEVGHPPLVLGDRVDVVAATVEGASARRVAEDAVVVGIGDEHVTVAVTRDELGPVARAVLDGTAVLALGTPG